MTSKKTRPEISSHIRISPRGPVTLMVAIAATGLGCYARGLPTIEPGDGDGTGGKASPGGTGGGFVATGGVIGSGGAGGARPRDPVNVPPFGNPPTSPPAANKLDLLFMIDDSASMAPLQAKLAQEIPSLLDGLRSRSNMQMPDLHVGVVSSSMGAGRWANVNQCMSAAYPGDDQGKLLQGPGGPGSGACAMLHMGQKFLSTGDGTSTAPNFDGDLPTAIQCMTALGDSGCGFESPFKSVTYALHKGQDPLDPDNGGFLRPDASLAIILFTNEDDCSVPDDSLLIDPGVNSVTDPTGLGALSSYRCNEFGHLCGGAPPPHGYDFATNTFNLSAGTFRTAAGPGMGGMVLNGCVSADGEGKTDSSLQDPTGQPDPSMGHLFGGIDSLVQAISSYKAAGRVFVAAIAGPTVDADGSSLYRVFAQANPAANELDPVVDHSCVQAGTNGQAEYADPAVRIHQLVDGFGANGAFYPICASNYSTTVFDIADGIQTVITH